MYKHAGLANPLSLIRISSVHGNLANDSPVLVGFIAFVRSLSPVTDIGSASGEAWPLSSPVDIGPINEGAIYFLSLRSTRSFLFREALEPSEAKRLGGQWSVGCRESDAVKSPARTKVLDQCHSLTRAGQVLGAERAGLGFLNTPRLTRRLGHA